MPKAFCTILLTAVLLAASPGIAAQVYRCESDGGVVFSDMPCSESAEQIEIQGDVVNMRGVGTPGSELQADPAQGAEPGSESGPAENTGQNLNQLLATLRSQLDRQIGILDEQLTRLRARAGSPEFSELEPDRQAAITEQIASLEANRATILSEYESLIAEAESRLE